jgi:2-polyprenyl-3-methyl-5-hydroxy-6-metoxy-1,4-benzoquinol methylase|tara:strand:- start:108 stop:791 length:684 start_codon:yes stop_codon:yes gene_type:complete
MSKINYDGFELDTFDAAKKFRNYQIYYLKSYIKDPFLEVGAGQGGLTNLYKKFTKDITLIEPDNKLFQFLRKKFRKKNIKIKNQTIDKIKFKYQTIIYFDVLEHIKSDLKEVKIASKKLKKNGNLIFNVPAHQLFYNEFDKAVGHFKRYNKKDFKDIEKKTDLKIEKLIYYDSIGLLFLILNKIFKLKETNLKNKIYFWNMLIPLSKIIDKLTFNKFGKSLLCVFKK